VSSGISGTLGVPSRRCGSSERPSVVDGADMAYLVLDLAPEAATSSVRARGSLPQGQLTVCVTLSRQVIARRTLWKAADC
jgi:hypothetical protein